MQEEVAKQNQGRYHIILPVALKNRPQTGKIIGQKEGPLPNGDIARYDVAKFIIEVILTNATGTQSISKALICQHSFCILRLLHFPLLSKKKFQGPSHMP